MLSKVLKKKLKDCPENVRIGIQQVKEDLNIGNLKVSKTFIYGSFIRSLWTNMPYEDIDIFTFNKSDWIWLYKNAQTLNNYGTYPRIDINRQLSIDKYRHITVAIFYTFTIEHFYFSFEDDSFLYSQNAFDHISNKILKVDVPAKILKINSNTINRTLKYISKGYSISLSDLHKIIIANNTNYAWRKEFKKYHFTPYKNYDKFCSSF